LVQRIDYATIRPDAFSQNLLIFQNQQVYDVAGRSASPYTAQTMFAAAPTRTYAPTGNVSPGSLDFWRVVGDTSGPERLQLVRTAYALPLQRGVNTLAIVR